MVYREADWHWRKSWYSGRLDGTEAEGGGNEERAPKKERGPVSLAFGERPPPSACAFWSRWCVCVVCGYEYDAIMRILHLCMGIPSMASLEGAYERVFGERE